MWLSAIDPATVGNAADFGPFAGGVAFLAGLGYLAREWRLGRQTDVAAAEARAEKAEKERDTDIGRVKSELEAVRTELEGVRGDMRQLRQHYDEQTAVLHKQIEARTQEAHVLREWILSGRAVTGALPPDVV